MNLLAVELFVQFTTKKWTTLLKEATQSRHIKKDEVAHQAAFVDRAIGDEESGELIISIKTNAESATGTKLLPSDIVVRLVHLVYFELGMNFCLIRSVLEVEQHI